MEWNVFRKGFIKKFGTLLLGFGVWLLMISGCGTPTPTLPVANAGPDQNVSTESVVALNGTGSTSSTGSQLSFAWTQTGGAVVTLTGADTATPTFTAPDQADTLTFQLIVSDENGTSNPDTVAITVAVPTSESPTANAGPDQNAAAGASVTLNGSGSTSQTGDPLSFAWTQTGGTAVILTGGNTANPTFTAPNQADTLTFQLVVNDVNGVSTPDTVAITVAAPISTPPIANAGSDQNVLAGASVTLNGSGSTSSTRSPLSFAWTQTGGTAVTLAGANTANPTFTAPNQADTLTFQLIVSDENGESNPDTVAITVTTPTSTPPVANAGPDQNVSTGSLVVLNGSGSTSQTGSPLSFAWTQTGGTAVTLLGANTATPIFTVPNQADTLTFQLIVTDINGASTPDTVTITVIAPTTESPTANAGPDQNVQGGATVTLNGSGSTSQTGSPLLFAWTQTGGTPVTLTGADTANPTFTAPNLSNVLTFQLVVSDENGVSTPDTVEITVTAPPVLFVTNRSPAKILSFTNPATLNGNIAPTTNLTGTQTMLNDPVFATVNSVGALNVTNITAVTIYNNPTTANGNVAPSANILGPQTQFTSTFGIAFDEDRNLLYVANSGATPTILVFANTTTTFGNLAPIRTITSPGSLSGPRGIFLDENDNLYVANSGAKNVLVFANASTLNGTVAPIRTISSASFTGALNDVFVDANNNLFVVNPPSQVLVFNNASTRNGNIMPDVILTVSGATSIRCIAVDSNGVGFITDGPKNAIYSYNQIATRNGTVAPDRTIVGAGTQLTSPHGLFLQE